MTLDELRQALSYETDSAQVEALRREYPHSISLVPDKDTDPKKRLLCNCHAFAFGLADTDELWRLRDLPEVWADARFVETLLETMTPKTRESVDDGDVVVYFYADGRIAHSAIVSGDGFRSKWSSGRLWDHGLFEIPLGYGASVRYFARPPIAQVVAAFESFAERVSQTTGTNRGDNRATASGNANTNRQIS